MTKSTVFVIRVGERIDSIWHEDERQFALNRAALLVHSGSRLVRVDDFPLGTIRVDKDVQE